MDKGVIKTKIIFEGEKEYLQALKNIKQEIRELKQEYEQLNEIMLRTSKLLADNTISQTQMLHGSGGK